MSQSAGVGKSDWLATERCGEKNGQATPKGHDH